MIIKQLGIENFKGVRSPVTFDFSPITLLFGPNSAGKSTILHAFSLLNDIINFGEKDSDTTRLGEGGINLGGFRQYVNGHDIEKSVVLFLGMDLKSADLVETKAAREYIQFYESLTPENSRDSHASTRDGLVELGVISDQIDSGKLRIELAWSHYKNCPFVKNLVLEINGEAFIKIGSTQSMTGATLQYLNSDHPVLCEPDTTAPVSILSSVLEEAIDEQFIDQSGTAFIGIEDTTDAMPNWKNELAFAEIWTKPFYERQKQETLFKGVLQAILHGSLEIAAAELKASKYIGPLRKVPDRHFAFSKSLKNSWADGIAAWDTMANRGENFVKEVNEWLTGEDHLNSGYAIEIDTCKLFGDNSRLAALLEGDDLNSNVDEIKEQIVKLQTQERLVLRDVRRDVIVQPLDVGAGISQVVPVIVGALEVEVGILLVEQPELHIHPKLQVELAELFHKASQSYGKQFLLETHSEHLVLRFLRRIREKHIDAKDVIIYYIDTVNGETKVRKIRIDQDGEFKDRWPRGGFFPERAKELF